VPSLRNWKASDNLGDAVPDLFDQGQSGGGEKRMGQSQASGSSGSAPLTLLKSVALTAILATALALTVPRPPQTAADDIASFVERWGDLAAPVRVIPLPTKPVKTLKIREDEPPPEVAEPVRRLQPPAARQDRAQAHDICRGRGRTWTKNGKSWRCNRPGQRSSEKPAKKRRK